MYQDNSVLKILIIDDSDVSVDIIRDGLKELPQPQEITLCRDGNKAFRYLKQGDENGQRTLPDLIILELDIPGIHGFELLKQIKLDDELKQIPVIVNTRSSRVEYMWQAKKWQDVEYLRKNNQNSKAITRAAMRTHVAEIA